ncbi:MAG: NUDIX domain-containing protein [Lachnospiraceae bacterium]|nr:NUDIX domain-containing protein [Lachnospiraceae bacterium]
MSELFDLVDEKGMPTGETVSRDEAHEKGIRHRTAHIWVVRKEGGKVQMLLQKRAQDKDSFPGCYDTSSAGHIQAGDEPMESARRELREELGIAAEEKDLDFAGCFGIEYEKVFHGKPFHDNEVAFVYVYSKPVELSELTLQEEEVESVAWFDVDDLQRLLEPRDSRFCVPTAGFLLGKKWCEEHL